MKTPKIIKKIKKSLYIKKNTNNSITPSKIFYIWDKNTLTKVETFVI
ncbi:MAG: hypothetical protein N2Z20_03575 [Elusimicrobiales bacterium]|nr:hypothetical protein [Elusimicrobiales bacterium]